MFTDVHLRQQTIHRPGESLELASDLLSARVNLVGRGRGFLVNLFDLVEGDRLCLVTSPTSLSPGFSLPVWPCQIKVLIQVEPGEALWEMGVKAVHGVLDFGRLECHCSWSKPCAGNFSFSSDKMEDVSAGVETNISDV